MSSSQERFKQRLKSYARTPGSFIVMLLVVLSAVLTFTVLIFLAYFPPFSWWNMPDGATDLLK